METVVESESTATDEEDELNSESDEEAHLGDDEGSDTVSVFLPFNGDW